MQAKILDIKSKMSPDIQLSMDYAQLKGASLIFSAVPLRKYGLVITSGKDFRDLIWMRYGMIPTNMPKS